MRWVNPVISLFLVCFSLLVLTTSLKLGIGNFQSPGPGFTGFLAAALLLCLSFIIFIRDSIKFAGGKEKGLSIGWGNLTKILILIAALWCYTLILGSLGFLVSTFFLMFVMLYVYTPSRKKWYRPLFIAFVITNAAYLVFHKWLQVVLPAGIFRIGW